VLIAVKGFYSVSAIALQATAGLAAVLEFYIVQPPTLAQLKNYR